MTVQSMEALQIANHVRITNAATRRRIAVLPRPDGLEEVARLLESDESPELSRMKAEMLIGSVHRLGPSTARTTLSAVGSNLVGKRVGDLTPRQRVAIAELLRGTTLARSKTSRAA